MAGRYFYVKTFLALAIVFWMVASIPAPAEHGRNAARATSDGSRTFVIGGLDFTNFIATLSPFKYTSTQEMMTIWPCMSTLLTFDPNGKLIGDIAESWTMSTDGLTWSFKLQPNLYFTDPTNPTALTHPLTWLDIQFTFFQVQNYTNNMQSSLLSADAGVIERIWGDASHVNLKLATPFAPFVNALVGIPIIPKYYWAPHEDVTGDATGWTGALPIGSGPWYYTLPGLPTTGEVVLRRSPIWFQEADRGWQLHVSTLKYRSESDSTTAWTDLKRGLIDLLLDVPVSTYINQLPSEPSLTGWDQETGFVYEYNLCQMTDTMRSSLGSPYTSGSSSQLLQDPVIKRAMAMAVDKQGFIDEVLDGMGTPADSLVPIVNPWHYSPQNQVSFDIAGANSLLEANGYLDIDADGYRECTAGCPAVVNGWASLGTELSFRFDTLSTSSDWQLGATLIRGWAAQIGVRMNLVIMTYSQMSIAWMYADYDTWLWDWMFSPISDPSTDVMAVLTTDKIGTWQDLYWSNKTFDSIYNQSLVQMDPLGRKALTDQLQQMAYDNMGCQPIAYRQALYAANCSRWTGSSFAGCDSEWALLPELCLPWLYMQLSPADNPVPVVATTGSVVATVGIPCAFTGTASDASELEYQWYWGDGSTSGWLTSPDAAHTFSGGGYFTAYLGAREIGTSDAFISVAKAVVYVSDPTNYPPHDLSFSVQAPRLEALMPINFTGSAIDYDPLSFSWDFGDSKTAFGVHTQHTYSLPGTYRVTMYVTDNLPDPGRPVSYSANLTIKPVNRPPTISVPVYSCVARNVLTYFHVNATDPDGDQLRFTWLWGDGALNVTSVPNAVHRYTHKQTYTLTVWVDDLTGVAGHNVSGSNTVVVQDSTQAPIILNYSAAPTVVELGEMVNFTGYAMASHGGILRFTFAFGDSTYEVVDTTSLLPYQDVSITVSHVYTSVGGTGSTKTTRLFVLDSMGLNTTSPPLDITIVAIPDIPVISPLDPVTSVVGQALSFTASAWDLNGSVFRYTWDFGDGSALSVGNPVTHTYTIPGSFTFIAYADDLSGLGGHNVSTSSTATIGFQLILQEGWNLISIPLEGTFHAGSLGLSPGDQVVGYNTVTGTYTTFVVGMPLNNFSMVKGLAYWIYSATQKSITLFGNHPTGIQTISIDVPEGGGWGLVGFCWPGSVPASQFTTRVTVTGGTVVALVRYNPYPYGTYQTYVPGMPLNNFMMVAGEGYWIFVSDDCVLTYDPDPGIIIPL